MNHSTEGVTLIAAFVSDVINLYEGKSDQTILKNMASDLSLQDPMKHVPMETYNKMCNWIEHNVGKANARLLGRKIGETAYQSMVAQKMVNENSSPIEMMKALQQVANFVIRDPQKRGWEIIKDEPKEIIMRRTQTFNGTLQLGLLDTLIRKTKVVSPSVDLIKEVALGDEYDEYRITWLKLY
ncbi:hypothetical protein [Fulvivirga lutea]|uniref:Uncharacterized protein n=1 Tax=Fulvivirga lutea TaxID=2810512 RepID=A0A974WMG1_9BACT|nr:hypothetical protein [Fulvivirga lutea]QSE98960.1 hypothetical protein JR347_07715 [Fulvivirga lutea]